MSNLAPTQELTRQDLEVINKALELYYLSDAVMTDEQELQVDLIRDKFSLVRFSDFSVCNLDTLI